VINLIISKNTYILDQLIEQLLREKGPMNPYQMRIYGAERFGVTIGQMIYLRYQQQLKSINSDSKIED